MHSSIYFLLAFILVLEFASRESMGTVMALSQKNKQNRGRDLQEEDSAGPKKKRGGKKKGKKAKMSSEDPERL